MNYEDYTTAKLEKIKAEIEKILAERVKGFNTPKVLNLTLSCEQDLDLWKRAGEVLGKAVQEEILRQSKPGGMLHR